MNIGGVVIQRPDLLGSLDLLGLRYRQSKLVPGISGNMPLHCCVEAGVARLESIDNQMPISDLILPVLAKDLNLLEWVIELSVSNQYISRYLDRVEFTHEFVYVIEDEVVFEYRHKVRFDVIPEQLDHFASFIEFVLDHELADKLNQGVTTFIVQRCVN